MTDNQSTEQRFNEIFRDQSPRLAKWLYWRLPSNIAHLSEDYVQETFHDLWVYLSKGRTVDYPWAFLKSIASRRMADHFHSKINGAVDIFDFDAPEATVIENSMGHRYAAGDPELSLLSAELDTAMERMREASAGWRKLHALSAKMRPLGESYPDRPGQAKREAARDKVFSDRDSALGELQACCAVVGELRGELERLGGGSWRSASGWPPPASMDGRHRVGTVTADVTVTRCSSGHRLDDLQNLGFTASGNRVCRSCAAGSASRRRAKLTAMQAGAQ